MSYGRHVGAISGHVGASLVPSRGQVEAMLTDIGASIVAVMGQLGLFKNTVLSIVRLTIVKQYWCYLGLFLGRLEATRCHLGAILEHLGPCWCLLGAIQRPCKGHIGRRWSVQ